MKRTKILAPGTYAAMPTAVLADPNLSPAAKLVYMILVWHLGPENDYAFPGTKTIMRETGIKDKKTIYTAIKLLTVSGYIQVERRENCSNRYFILSADPSTNLKNSSPDELPVEVPEEELVVEETNYPSGKDELGVVEGTNYSSGKDELGVVRQTNQSSGRLGTRTTEKTTELELQKVTTENATTSVTTEVGSCATHAQCAKPQKPSTYDQDMSGIHFDDELAAKLSSLNRK